MHAYTKQVIVNYKFCISYIFGDSWMHRTNLLKKEEREKKIILLLHKFIFFQCYITSKIIIFVFLSLALLCLYVFFADRTRRDKLLIRKFTYSCLHNACEFRRHPIWNIKSEIKYFYAAVASFSRVFYFRKKGLWLIGLFFFSRYITKHFYLLAYLIEK